MKKIFSSLLLIFTFPFKLLKRVKIDNFVGGLIFGAIFALLVNLVTVQLQEIVQKQRVLEALENEIVRHAIQAKGTITENDEKIAKNEPPNTYSVTFMYSDKVWSTTEALKYTFELDPEVQGKVSAYYDTIIYGTNFVLERAQELTRSKLSEDCFFEFKKLSSEKQKECLEWYQLRLNTEADFAVFVYEKSRELSKEFHPTKDRLNNFILRTLLGSKAIGAMALPP